MRFLQRSFILIFLFLFSFQYSFSQENIDQNSGNGSAAKPALQPVKKITKQKVDPSLEPKFATAEPSPLFENVIAVQKKAKVKNGMWIFYPFLSADFSDAPYTMWGMNLNIGKAIGEYWELYLNAVPYYLTQERPFSKKVSELVLANGKKASIDLEKAKMYYGIEANFVPAYGKDSWGPFGIIRSDFFLNTGVGMVQYENGNGLRTKIGLGKTFFITPSLNIRMMAGGSFVQMISGGEKQTVMVGLLEGGFVFYF